MPDEGVAIGVAIGVPFWLLTGDLLINGCCGNDCITLFPALLVILDTGVVTIFCKDFDDLLESFGEVELPTLGSEFVIGPFKVFGAWLPLTIRFCVFVGADIF